MTFQMDEDYVELNVVEIAENAGFYQRKVNWQGRRNAPDRVFAHKSLDRDIWIEFKAPGETPRTGQRIEHQKMREAGMAIYVCDRIDDALSILGIPCPPITADGRLI